MTGQPVVAERQLFADKGREFIRHETVETRAGDGPAQRSAGIQALRRDTIDDVGALLESLGEHAEGAVEHRAHQRAQDAALELVVDEEADVAAAAMPARNARHCSDI